MQAKLALVTVLLLISAFSFGEAKQHLGAEQGDSHPTTPSLSQQLEQCQRKVSSLEELLNNMRTAKLQSQAFRCSAVCWGWADGGWTDLGDVRAAGASKQQAFEVIRGLCNIRASTQYEEIGLGKKIPLKPYLYVGNTLTQARAYDPQVCQ